jgi:hypothetical protein
MSNGTGRRDNANLSNRLSRSDPTFTPSSATEQLARNPYIAPEDLMQYMVDEDDEMSLFAVSDLPPIIMTALLTPIDPR